MHIKAIWYLNLRNEKLMLIMSAWFNRESIQIKLNNFPNSIAQFKMEIISEVVLKLEVT